MSTREAVSGQYIERTRQPSVICDPKWLLLPADAFRMRAEHVRPRIDTLARMRMLITGREGSRRTMRNHV